MNEIRLRLKALRLEMLKHDLDAWYISGTDPHASEYLPDRWQTRAFISGFTGSHGIVVVTQEEAGLWTDTRYFLQAEEQLKGSGIKMYKLRVPDAISPEEWLVKKLDTGSKVGFDPQTLTVAGFRSLKNSLQKKEIDTVQTPDLFEKIWENRPEIPKDKIIELDTKYTGLSRKEKRERVVSRLKDLGADFQVVTALDDLAWFFNLRGSDIAYNPVFTGYGVAGKKESVLFTDPEKISPELKTKLEKERVEIHNYFEFWDWLKSIKSQKVLLDPASANFAVWETLHANNYIKEETSVISMLKAQKNNTELAGFREAMKKDGAALMEILFWLKNSAGREKITEYTVAQKLTECRAKQEDFRGESFPPIVGYKEHGAIVHLNVGPGNALPLEKDGILLFDSGGQYL
ncbi:MAG: aminopeptidase P family N-terminal domain-containing protein, partial [Tangfeifania sp.]